MHTAPLSSPQLRLEDSPQWATVCVDRLTYHAYLRQDTEYVDGLLELKYALLLSKEAEGIIRAFYQVWPRFKERDYAMFFKLRRWLEQRIVVRRLCSQLGWTDEKALTLGFDTFPRLVRTFQNEWFQNHLGVATLEDVEVHFEWLDRPPTANKAPGVRKTGSA